MLPLSLSKTAIRIFKKILYICNRSVGKLGGVVGGRTPPHFDKLFQIFPLWTLELATTLILTSMYVL